MSKLFQQVRDAIDQSSLLRADLCRASGVSPSSLSQFMAGDKGLSMEAIDRLLACLGLEITLQPTTTVRPKKSVKRRK